MNVKTNQRTNHSGSCHFIGDGRFPKQDPQELIGDGFEIVGPGVHGAVGGEVLFADASEGAEEIAESGPEAFDGVVVDFVDAVAIEVFGPDPFARCVADGDVGAVVLGDAGIARPFVGVHGALRRGRVGDERGQRWAVGRVADAKSDVSGVTSDHAEHGRPIVFPVAVASRLVGSAAGRVVGMGMRNAFFPPHFDTSRRTR